MKRWVIILLSFVGLAIVTAAGYWGFRSSAAQNEPTAEVPTTVAATTCDVQQSVTAPGNLVNLHQVNVEMPADGSLQEILVRPGDHVQEGQVLARLDDPERFTSAVTDARLELLQAQQDLEDLRSANAADQAQAQLEVANAQETLDKAQRKRNAMNYPHSSDKLVIEKAETDYLLAKDVYKDALRAYQIYEKKPLTNQDRVLALSRLVAAKQDMDTKFAIWNWYLLKYTENDIAQADGEVAVAETDLADAQAKWERLKAGPDPLALDLAQAKIDSAQAELNEAERDLEAVEIKAPFDGVVLEVSANPGETLTAHSKVIVLNDPLQVEIEATVTEEDFPLLRPGQSAQVYFTARPDVTAQGKVDRIVPTLLEGSSPTYDIFISLDQIPEGLVDGMTVDTNVTIASRPGVICLPRSVVHASADNKAILLVWNGMQTENRQVTIGLRGDSNVEILSGLKEGEQVVVK